MLHPRGPQPAAVYWRRRFVFLVFVVALLVLMVTTLRTAFGGASSAAASRNSLPTTHAAVKSPAPPQHHKPARAGHAPSRSASPSRSRSASAVRAAAAPSTSSAASSAAATPSAAPAPCELWQLNVVAQTAQTAFGVTAQPVLSVKVTNVGAQPCVQDLADRRIAFTIYNGESRVWGSHDCQVQPGVSKHTLLPDSPVLVSVTWSGLSSEPGCTGVRQRVGVGTYTLYVTVSGKVGKAAQFVIR
jgi:hypothetical protein